MSKYKRVLKDYSILDHKTIEDYLLSMAKKGYILKSIAFNLFTFTIAPPEERKYGIRIKAQDLYIKLKRILLPSHLIILIPVLIWLVIGFLGINRLRPEILASNLSDLRTNFSTFFLLAGV